MGIENYPDQLEPENQDAVIWRFINMGKFRDLMTTAELYFCRADLFSDEREGLPPEEYLATFGLNPYDVNDRRELLNHIGSDAQFREGFYVNCWYLFREETSPMWKEYGSEGVAIASRYRLLKSALNSLSDRAYIGLVGYGAQHLIGKRANLFRYITTKRIKYAYEQEVRAFLWIMDPRAGINRHYDENNRVHPVPLTPPPDYVSKGERRKVDLETLVTEVVVSPWASSTAVDEIRRVVGDAGYKIPVLQSGLARYATLLP
ncbi:MAG: hypothetical protein ACRD59_17875 [Candidatus Acidiferrales bacterium]